MTGDTPSLDRRRTGGGSIGTRFAAGTTSGFDYLRLSLSLIVMLWHSDGVIGVNRVGDRPVLEVFARIAVPMFFALSGFLVSSSLDRLKDVRRFLVNRFLRVLPALACVVVLSALVLGPAFTTRDLPGYFASPLFARYFLNLVGVARFLLPGVFEANATAEVNGSLWTIPLELQCYVALAVVFVAGGFRRTAVLVVGLVVLTAACAWFYRTLTYDITPVVPGRLVMAYFLAGVIVYRIRFCLPGGPLIAAALLVVAWAMLADIRATYLSPFVVAYAAAAIGCTAPRRLRFVFAGDYSYGIYLYGMPIQQALVVLLGPFTVWLHFPVSVAITAAFAVVSWHFVERPALALKSRFRRRTVGAPAQAA